MNSDAAELRSRLDTFESAELLEKIRKGYLTEEAEALARDILRDRHVDAAASTQLQEENGSQLEKEANEVGFQWWQVWAWLGLTLGNVWMLVQLRELAVLAFLLIVANSVLLIMVLRYNKYAFLIATILSFNPLLWIINGIYLKRRWHHPKVNAQILDLPTPPTQTSSVSEPTKKYDEAAVSSVRTDAEPISISTMDEEAIYEAAANEIGSDSLKKGLWAKSFADADGNEMIAKARYIKVRGQQLLAEHQERAQNEKEERRHAVEADNKKRLSEEQINYERLPKGKCPNCDEVIPLDTAECPACHATFTGNGSWRPRRI